MRLTLRFVPPLRRALVVSAHYAPQRASRQPSRQVEGLRSSFLRAGAGRRATSEWRTNPAGVVGSASLRQSEHLCRALFIALNDGLERRLVGPPENRKHQLAGQPGVFVVGVPLYSSAEPLVNVNVIATAVRFSSGEIVGKRFPPRRVRPKGFRDFQDLVGTTSFAQHQTPPPRREMIPAVRAEVSSRLSSFRRFRPTQMPSEASSTCPRLLA